MNPTPERPWPFAAVLVACSLLGSGAWATPGDAPLLPTPDPAFSEPAGQPPGPPEPERPGEDTGNVDDPGDEGEGGGGETPVTPTVTVKMPGTRPVGATLVGTIDWTPETSPMDSELLDKGCDRLIPLLAPPAGEDSKPGRVIHRICAFAAGNYTLRGTVGSVTGEDTTTVLPADSVDASGGTTTDDDDPEFVMKFTFKAGGQDLGPCYATGCQESQSQGYFDEDGDERFAAWDGWWPDPAGGACTDSGNPGGPGVTNVGTFCWSSPDIYDTKTVIVKNQQQFDAIPVGGVMNRYRQKVRIGATYLCPDPFTPNWWGEETVFELTYTKAEGGRVNIAVRKL